MPAPNTVGEFLDLVRKSGVLDDKRLDTYVEKATGAGVLPTEPSKLAGILVRDGILTHFQAEQFLLGKWRRFTIGKYKVLERIGSGGMGSVYLCEHKLMRRRVAVKVLPTQKADDTSSLERFHREARVVAALDHVNIVRAYDVDQDGNLHFLVMEYVDGASLQEMVKRGGVMDVTRAAHYMRQSAFGLQNAHETAGIVHRDIKPGNILVDRTGVVKILDMGLARFFNDDEDILTKKFDENVLGTADYLAPEQALDSHSVDIRADIYSLGATFYFCLTGRSPFNEGTVAQKLIWHQTRQPKSVRSLRPEVPVEVEALIEKMMAKDRNVRFQTPLEVADALEPFTRSPIGPPPEIEMPQLCLAAKGLVAGDSGPITPGPLSPVPGSAGNRKSWQIAGVTDSRPTNPNTPSDNGAAPTRSSQPAAQMAPPSRPLTPALPPSPPIAGSGPGARPATATATAQPPPAAARTATAPAPNGKSRTATAAESDDEDSIPWEQIAAHIHTEVASGKVVETPRSLKKTASSRRVIKIEPSDDLKRRKQVIRLVGLITGAIVTGILLALIFTWIFKPSPPPSHGSDNRTDPQTLTVGKGEPFPSLIRALEKAKSGDRIVLKDQVIEEDTLKIDGIRRFRGLKNITVEAGPETLWRIAAKGAISPKHVLYLDSVEGWTFKNITFDGGHITEDVIVLSGNCPGLTLENLRLQGFKHYGLQIINCAGTADKPVSVVDLTFLSEVKGTPQAPIHIGTISDITSPKTNQFIVIRNCHLRGPFVNGQAPKADGVEIVNWHTVQ